VGEVTIPDINAQRDQIAFDIANTRCMNKRVYPSMKVAAKFAAAHGRKFKKPMSPYLCPVCGLFHTTTNQADYVPRKDLSR